MHIHTGAPVLTLLTAVYVRAALCAVCVGGHGIDRTTTTTTTATMATKRIAEVMSALQLLKSLKVQVVFAALLAQDEHFLCLWRPRAAHDTHLRASESTAAYRRARAAGVVLSSSASAS